MDKKGQMITLGTLLVVAVIVGAILLITGTVSLGGDSELAAKQQEQEQLAAVDTASCDGVSSVTYTLVDRDQENLGSTPGVDARVFMANGNKVDKRVASGGTISLTPKKEHKALVGNGSSDFYAREVSFSTGCSNDDLISDLADAGTLTLTAFNDDDGEPNAAGDRFALGQNVNDLEIEVKYDMSSSDFWGNPQAPGLSRVTCQYDKTDISNIKVDGASSSSKPSVFAFSVSPNVGGAGADAYDGDNSYIVSNLADGGFETITLLVDSVSGSNPGDGNFTCNFYDSNLDLDAEDLTVLKGVEDEDFNLLSIATANITVHYS